MIFMIQFMHYKRIKIFLKAPDLDKNHIKILVGFVVEKIQILPVNYFLEILTFLTSRYIRPYGPRWNRNFNARKRKFIS